MPTQQEGESGIEELNKVNLCFVSYGMSNRKKHAELDRGERDLDTEIMKLETGT